MFIWPTRHGAQIFKYVSASTRAIKKTKQLLPLKDSEGQINSLAYWF
jgi:hypothetical protein